MVFHAALDNEVSRPTGEATATGGANIWLTELDTQSWRTSPFQPGSGFSWTTTGALDNGQLNFGLPVRDAQVIPAVIREDRTTAPAGNDCVARLIPGESAMRPQTISWREDDAYAAYEQARDGNKPLVVYFHAVWCGYCHQLEKDALSSPQLQQFADDAVFVRANIDRYDPDYEEMMERLQIENFPAIAVFDIGPDGRLHLAGRIIGYHTEEQFMTAWKRIMRPDIVEKYYPRTQPATMIAHSRDNIWV